MSIANFSVRNGVFVNMLMIGLFLYGIYSFFSMPVELNPPVPFNWVFITVPYPGASPVEVENLIIDPIEAEVKDIEKIDEIQSTAGESIGFVLIKFEDISDSEFRERYLDLKAEIDKVEFPDEAEDPIIDDFNSEDFLPIITVNMSFTIPEANAQIIADEIKEDLEDMTGISKVQVSGLPEREIWVEVDPVKLNSYNLSINDVMMALMSRNLNIPGGNISIGKKEYFIRSLGEYANIEEIENTVLRNRDGGSFIKIRDVASVNDTREEVSILSRLNGDESITFSVSKKSDANSNEAIDRVKNLIASYEERVQDGVEFSFTNDNSIYINRVMNTLRNNAVSGMILIIIILYLFLGGYNSVLAALGIPISFFITFIFMDLWGYSMNGSTMFALVMVLGIIVDDAIIVIENCHRYRLMGYSSHQAAVLGTNEVIKPILSSIGTNIAAFLPLMLLPGIMGKFMRIIPLVFSLALVASMFEAFILLPSHYSDWTTKSKVYSRGEKKFFTWLRNKYENLLVRVVRRRYWALLVMIVVFFTSVLTIIPHVGIEMFGDEDFDQFKILVKCPEGTSLEETDRIMKKYEAEALKLPEDHIEAVIANIGLLQGNNEWLTRKNVAQIFIQLKPIEERIFDTEQLMEMLRLNTTYISGPRSVEFEMVSGGPPVGKPISVKVQGKYLDEIKDASLELQDFIREQPGAKDITDDFPPGKEEIRVIIDQEKAALYGFNTQLVALAVKYAFDGIDATEFRDGDDEVDVVVKYATGHREDMGDILNLRLTNPAGATAALRDMVEFETIAGPTSIKRFDQKRTILVTGEINEEETSLDKVNNAMIDYFPVLEEKYPGISFEMGGQFEEFMNVFKDVGALFVLSLVLIFLILGTQFNSYSQPLVILTTVPFALIGALIGLLISDNPFSVVALFGFVALAGIVVNDAIVMITFLNDRRPEGEDLGVYRIWRSIIDSGRLRLRPIILTSMTTILGLAPMAWGIGGMSEMWSPLANVILWGLLGSTILTLFIIPSFIAILDDIRGLRRKARLRE